MKFYKKVSFGQVSLKATNVSDAIDEIFNSNRAYYLTHPSIVGDLVVYDESDNEIQPSRNS